MLSTSPEGSNCLRWETQHHIAGKILSPKGESEYSVEIDVYGINEAFTAPAVCYKHLEPAHEVVIQCPDRFGNWWTAQYKDGVLDGQPVSMSRAPRLYHGYQRTYVDWQGHSKRK